MSIITLEETTSTNDYLKNRADLLAENFLIVRAIRQTEGRGRQGKTWLMKGGLDLAFSMVYHPSLDISRISGISLLAGLAIHRALRVFSQISPMLKWPNDIMIDDHKIAGILCESLCPANQQIVIIGIGINVNSRNFSEIGQKATSLSMALGKDIHIENLFKNIILHLKSILRKTQAECTQQILSEYKKYCVNMRKKVFYRKHGKTRVAIAEDITASGAMILDEKGHMFEYTGEILCPEK